MPGASYENRWRPASEAKAGYVWLVAMVLTVPLAMLEHIPTLTMVTAVCVMGFFGLFRLGQALRIWHWHSKLGYAQLEVVEPEPLRKKARKDSRFLYLGKGFEWTPLHAHRIHQLLKSNVTSIEPGWLYRALVRRRKNQSLGGAPWIHGVGDDEAPFEWPVAELEGHCFIVGAPGSGKTRLAEIIATNLIHYQPNEAVIVLDPKADKDLSRRIALEAEKAGRGRDFVFFHPAHPAASVRVDPLRNWNRPTEIASRIAALLPSETGNDPFTAFSWRAVNLIVGGLLLVYERPNIMKLYSYIEGGIDGLLARTIRSYASRCGVEITSHALDGYIKRLSQARGRQLQGDIETHALVGYFRDKLKTRKESKKDQAIDVIEGLISMFQHSREHAMKMLASLTPTLQMLVSSELRELLSPDYEDPSDLRPITDLGKIAMTSGIGVFNLDSLSDQTVGSAIGSILLADLVAVSGDRYNFGSPGNKVNLIIDESAELANRPFVSLLAKARGSGVRVFFLAQTVHDFEARFGSAAVARQVLGNANNLIALRLRDNETQKYVAENFGETAIKTIMDTQSTNAGDVVDFTAGYGERLIEESAALFPPELIGRLPNFHFIAATQGGKIIKGRVPVMKMDTPANYIDPWDRVWNRDW